MKKQINQIATVEISKYQQAQGKLIAILDNGKAIIDVGGGKKITGTLVQSMRRNS